MVHEKKEESLYDALEFISKVKKIPSATM